MTPAEIRAARKALGLTQQQAAEVLDYGEKSRISDIETGRKPPGPRFVLLLQAYLAGYRPDCWPE